MLQLYLYDYNEAYEDFPPKSLMSLEAFVTDPPVWKDNKYNLYECILRFDKLPDSVNEDYNNFGYLPYIIPQFIEIEKRISNNQFALLRTVTDNAASYFIFEPKQTHTYFSPIKNLPAPMDTYFPFHPSPFYFSDNRNQQKELYEYVEKNIENIKPELIKGSDLEHVQNMLMPTGELLVALKKQIEWGEKVLQMYK